MKQQSPHKSLHFSVRKYFILLKFCFLSVLCSLAVAQAGAAVQRVIPNFKVNNATLTEVLKSLETMSGYTCLYSNEDVSGVRNLTLAMDHAPVEKILDRCLSGTSLEYVIEDETIIIRKTARVTRQPAAQERTIQERTVQGTVKDVYGLPVIGAGVVIKGTSRGIATDQDGRFSLPVPGDENIVLQVSFIGMKNREVPVTGNDPVHVILEEDQTQIEDVVVTGMFTRDARSFTGSVVSLGKEELFRVGNQNVLQSIKNLDPSLMIFDNLDFGSDPNRMPSMQLRGTSSFNLQDGEVDLKEAYGTDPNAPLFILDGFEATVERIIDLDMNRVESVTILKDASAKAIYGSKAANGVVVIETKRTTDGELRITYTGKVDISAPDLSSYDLLNAAEKLEIEKEAGMHSPDPNRPQDDPVPYLERYNRILTAVLAGVDTDWMAKPLRNGVGTKHALSIELGNNDLRVIGDLSYNKITGVMKGSDRRTTSGSVMVSYRHKRFNFRNTLSITSNVANNSPYGQFQEYVRMNPYWSPYDENGMLVQNVVFQYSNNPETETAPPIDNPLYNAKLGGIDKEEYLEVVNNSFVEWHILPGLKATGRLGISEKRSKADEFYPANHLKFKSYKEDEFFRRGSYRIDEGQGKGLQADVNINGSQAFGADQKHVIFGNLGFELATTSYETTTYNAEGFPNEAMNNIIFARQYAKDGKPTGTESTVNTVGAVAVASYSYDYRYLLDASLRTSASSQYGSNNRWGQFWSVGAGWNIHNEKWLKKRTAHLPAQTTRIGRLYRSSKRRCICIIGFLPVSHRGNV